MDKIEKVFRTDNYEIAAICMGDPESSMVYKHHPGLVEHYNLPHIHNHLEFMANLGFYAISQNAPGIWGSHRLDGVGTIYDYTMHHTTDAGEELSHKLITEKSSRRIIVAGNSGGCRAAVWEAASISEVVGYVSIFGAATWIRESNRTERTITWKERGFKDFSVDPPGGGEPISVRVPWKYSETAPTYDADEVVRGVFKPKLIIGGNYDNVAHKPDVIRFHDIAPNPKSLKWIDCNHFYLPPDKATVQEKDEKYDKIPRHRRYSDPEILKAVNEALADWLEQHKLLPSQLGRIALKT